MPHTSLRRYRPEFDLLESRLTPAGNVTAVVRGTTLVIVGDTRDNAILISQRSMSNFTITPLDDSTRINRRAQAASFRNVHAIQINLGNGQDVLQLGADKGEAMILARHLLISGGSGNKTVQTFADLNVGGRVGVTTSSGHDTIELGGTLYAHGDVNINAGRGDNSIIMVPTGGTNTITGDLIVSNGRGASTTAIFDTSVLSDLNLFAAGHAERGAEIFFGVSSGDVKSAILGSATLAMSQGPGAMSLMDTNIAGNLVIHAATTATRANPMMSVAVGPLVHDSEAGVAGNFSVFAGAPVSLQLGTQEGGVVKTLNVGGKTLLRTGDGNDLISLRGLVSRLDTEVSTANGGDLVTLDDSLIFGALRVGLGVGDDTFLIESNESALRQTEFLKEVVINLGVDDDSLLVGMLGDAARSVISHFGPTRFDGGAGVNTLLNASANLTMPDGGDSPFHNFE